MRIHSDIITRENLIDAVRYAGRQGHGDVQFLGLSSHGSRKRDHAFEVGLKGDGTVQRRRTQHDRDEYAASWQQWGWFLAFLFQIDPNMDATYYKGEDNFHARTRGEFLVGVTV